MSFICATDISLPREQVAIAITKGAFGSHIGIMFHSAKDGLQLLHLRFHKDLSVESFPVTPPVTWVASPPNIHIVASKALVGLVRSIAKRRPQIKYGINVEAAKDSISPSGAYKLPKGSDGLTCATFVVEVFRAASLPPLIALETWHATPENKIWGEGVCKLLEHVGADPLHVAEVRANINGLRVRPEEVAAATQFPSKSLPVKFEAAASNGAMVMNALHWASFA